MGYTLAAALLHLGADGEILVAELAPAVIAWNRGPLGDLAGHPLKDSRVTIFEGDVARLLQAPERPYDAVLLDVDNGPEGLTRGGNNWLYGRTGVETICAALRRGGVLGVWSASPDRAFTRRLHTGGFQVEEYRLPSGSTGGRPHTIWIGERRA